MPSRTRIACPVCGEPMTEAGEGDTFLWQRIACPACRWMILTEFAVETLLKDPRPWAERAQAIKARIAGTPLAERKELPPDPSAKPARTPAQKDQILAYVAAHPNLPISPIAEGLGLSMSKTLSGIRRLEKAGAIVGQPIYDHIRVWRTPDRSEDDGLSEGLRALRQKNGAAPVEV